MDNGTEMKSNYAASDNLIGVDENYLSQLKAEAEKLESSFPLCTELLARGMLKCNWTTRGYANSLSSHLADWTARGLVKPRTTTGSGVHKLSRPRFD